MGDTYVWTRGSKGGDLTVAANWDDVSSGQSPAPNAPGYQDQAEITGAGTVYAGDIVNYGGIGLLASGGSLKLADTFVQASSASFSGVVALEDSALVLTNTVAVTGTSVLTIGDGSSVGIRAGLDGAMMVGATASDNAVVDVTGATADLTIEGGEASVSDFGLRVGDDSHGAMTVGSGADVTVEALTGDAALLTEIGDGDGNGSLTVTGEGSEFSNDGMYVGVGTTGTVTVSAGGELVTKELLVGASGFHDDDNAYGGTGVINVLGAGSRLEITAGFLVVGTEFAGGETANNGSILVANGALLRTAAQAPDANQPTVSIGDVGTGTLTVSGADALAEFGGQMVVGDDGTGYVKILNAGTVSMDGPATENDVFLGYTAAGAGTVTVSGVGSLFDLGGGGLFIGNAGKGELVVSAGGVVHTGLADGRIDLGDNPGGSGVAIVTGAGSTWTAKSNLVIGEAGTGTLEVAAGGTMSLGTGNATIGATLAAEEGSTGILTVTGAGSRMSILGDLQIAVSGTATTTVSSGGSLTASSLELGQAGAPGTDRLSIQGTTSKVSVLGSASLSAGTITMGGGTLAVGGTLNLKAGLVTGDGAVDAKAIINSATVQVTAQTLTLGAAISGSGLLKITSGATLALGGAVGAGQTATFAATHGVLDLLAPANFAGVAAGFLAGDTIDLAGVTESSLSYAGDKLTVHEAGGGALSLTFAGSNTLASFHATSDGKGGTLLTHT